MRSITGLTFGRTLAATVLAGSALIPAAAAANAADTPVKPLASGVFMPIRNVGTNLCLEPAGQSMDGGVAIVQAPCVLDGNERFAQGWQYVKTATNHYKLINQLSGLCIRNKSIANGASVHQWPCSQISDEEYNMGTSLPAVTKIESRLNWKDSGSCIDVPGGVATVGQAMQIAKCNGSLAQTWVIGF